METESDKAQKVDCGVLIALEEEFTEFLRVFQPGAQTRVDDEVYHRFYFKDSRGVPRSGVATLIGRMGLETAALKTERLISVFSPDLIVNVGIAGAVSADLQIGDVVVAEEVDNYTYRGKVGQADDGEALFQWGGTSMPSDMTIARHIKDLSFDYQARLEQWRHGAKSKFDHVVPEQARRLLRSQNLVRDKPRVWGGAIASGPFVVTSTTFKDSMSVRNRNYLAVEMEAAGILTAALDRRDKRRCLVIRAISDFADNRKNELDGLGKGVLRSWAMSNATELLALALECCVDFAAQQDPAPTQIPLPESRLRILVERLHQAIKEKYIAEKLQDFLERDVDGRLLRTYGRLLACVSDHKLGPPESFIPDLAKFVRESSSKSPVKIDGLPGTGKSTMLTLLYYCLYRQFLSDSRGPIPVYIDLHYYDWALYIGKDSPEDQVRLTCSQDLEPLLSVAREFPQSRFIIILDGIDEYVRLERTVEGFILQLTDSIPNKKIIGLGLADNPRDEYFWRDTSHLGRFQAHITLWPLALSSPDIRLFIDLFAQISDNQGRSDHAFDLLRRFNLKTADVLTLSLMFSVDGDMVLSGLSSFSAFLRQYCEELLRLRPPTNGRSYSLSEAAALAYRYAIAKEAIPPEQLYGDPYWKLAHRHPSIKEFLVGYHIVNNLKAIGRKESNNYSQLAHVFPHGINRAQKEIMNFDVGSQRAVLDGLIAIYEQGPEACKPHVCYLAGRLEDYNLRNEARKFLLQCKDEYFRCQRERKAPPTGDRRRKKKRQRKKVGGPTRKDLLLIRTIYISLVELGEKSAAVDYIKQLIAHPDWDNLNRGFHLEYYGDIPYAPGLDLSMTHEDRLGDCSKTLGYLKNKILRESRDGTQSYPLMDVEVYTALSLAQHRHAKGKLPDDLRESVLSLARQLVDQASLSRQVQRYCKMLIQHLQKADFNIGNIAIELYALKGLPRSGWVKRGILKPESVAEHTLGTYLLGLLYLPPEYPSLPGYNKHQILDMLLVHEFAEARMGDLLPSEKDEIARRREAAEFAYLGLAETYPGVFGLFRAELLWRDFQAGSTINAQIAKEIDKLENLMQLYLYRRIGHNIADFFFWEGDLIDAINTEPGQAILRIIRSTFADVASVGYQTGSPERESAAEKQPDNDLAAGSTN